MFLSFISQIVAYMVMSILSAVLAGGQVIFESIGAIIAQEYGYHYDYDYNYGGWEVKRLCMLILV